MTELPSPAQLLDLTGRVVVITGSGGGIGAGIARRFASTGASLVLHTRRSPVPPVEADAVGVEADLAAASSPAELVEAALERFGRIDALINNAGIQPLASLMEMNDEAFRSVIDVNLMAVHRLTRLVAEQMAERGGGAIVHIASIEGRQPAPQHGHYAAAKAGLLMHARAAALEWGRYGIRVNAVSPGLIDRPGLEGEWPEGVHRWRQAAPLERLGAPEDVGDACVFLCSPLARWITGIDLVVDGGVLAHPTW